MPRKPFNELLADPRFRELAHDEQLSTVDRYWDAFKTERPENAEFADSQRSAAKAMLDIRKQAETATEAEKRLLRPIQHQLIDSIDIGNDRAWGRIDEATFNSRVEASKAKQAELEKDAEAVRSYYSPSRIGALSKLIGGEPAKRLAGGKSGVLEGVKGSLNDFGDTAATVTQVLVDAGGDLTEAESAIRESAAATRSNPYAGYTSLTGGYGVVSGTADATEKAQLEHLNRLREAFSGVPVQERLPILRDVAKMTAWTDGDTVRRLSLGGVTINPQKLFGDKQAVIAEIDALGISDAAKSRAKEQFEQMRSEAADPTIALLTQNDSGFDSAFKSGMATESGVGNKADFLDSWIRQQAGRNPVVKTLDALWSGVVVNGGVGMVKTVLGATSGVMSAAGPGVVNATLGPVAGIIDAAGGTPAIAGAYDSVDRTASGKQEAQQLRGLTGGYGVTKDLAGTITQMAPMFIGGAAAQGLKGLSAAATSGMSVYGWAGMQGYESAMATELEIARQQRGALSGSDVEEVLGSGKAQLAGFANAVQTAVLSKVLGGGAEAAALGKAGEAMTVRDFLTRGGRTALQDSTLRKELGTMAKSIFVNATDEAVEETLNQALENVIASRIQGADRKLGDVISESLYAGAMGAIAGGATPQALKGSRTPQKTDNNLSTHELDDAELQALADAALLPNIAPEKELPQGTTPAGTNKNAGAPPVAGSPAAQVEMTPEEFTAAKQERLAELRAVPALSTDEAAELKLLDTGTDEQIAAELGVSVVKPQETPASAAAQPTETLPAAPSTTGVAGQEKSVATPTTTQTNEEDQKRQGQGRTEVLTAGPAALSEKWKAQGVSLDLSEATGGINEPGSIKGDIVIDRLRVPEDRQRAGVGSAVLADVKALADETSRGVEVLPVQLGNQTVEELENFYTKNGFVPFDRGEGRQRGFRYTPGQAASELEPVTTQVPASKAASSTTTEAAAKTTPAPTKEDGEYSAAARAVDEDPSPENVARFMLAAMGLKPVDKAPVTVSEEDVPDGPLMDKNGQLRLFQNPERAPDTNNSPAVGRYLRTVPEPVESTVSLLNTVVDELPLNDAELNQNRTQQRISKLVRDTMKKHTKPVGKGDNLRFVVKLGSIKMNELMGRVWKMKNRVLPGWKNFRSAEAVLQRARIIAYEIASSISKTGSGNDWYSGKINEMYQKLSRFYPELREPGQDRFIFSTILAITSNGENVFSNMVHTINLYNKVRGQGRMPNESDATGEARRETAMFKGFATVQRLIDEGGWQKVDSEFRQNVPYRDMKKRYKIEGKEEKQEQLVSNAYVLGSKIGAFWGNLNGNFGHIAMDLWFTRTMARLSGDFKTIKPTNLLNIQKHFRMLTQMDNVPDDVKGELQHFLNAIPKLDEAPNWTSVPEEVRAQIPLAHKWIKDSYKTLSNRKNPETGKGFFRATPEESSAKIVHILLDQANRAPDDAEHRNWMRRVMSTAQKHLKSNGIDMSLAEMQAVMWFYEKDLYTKFGATSKRGERADFSEAADYGLARVRQEAFVGDAGPRQDDLVQGTLFQNEEAPKGSYLPAARNAGTAILDLATGKADQTTGLHEAAHTTFDFMDQAKLLTEDESKAVKDWASNGTGKLDVAAWEKFARGWERFVLDGVRTGIDAVDKVFAKIAAYIANVYKNVTGSSIDIKIPDNIREIFNKMAAAGYTLEKQGKAPQPVPVKIKAQPTTQPANKTAGKATKKLPKYRPSPSTAIYNAAVDAELVRNGMTPILKEAAVALQDTWDDSLARMANNPDAGRQLVAELLSRPRVASDIEHGLLLQEFAAQKVAVARARNNMLQDPSEGARRVLEDAMDRLYNVAHASKLAGAEWGRAGRFRQIRIAEDYSIESMQTRYAAEVKGGGSLTPAESKKIAELSEKLREMEKEEESLVSRLRDAERALEEAAQVEHIEKQAKREKAPPSEQKRATVAKKITDRVSSARDRLAKMGFGGRLQQSQEPTLLYQKPEPESLDPQVLSDLADVGVEYLNNGDATIGKFTDSLVSEFGDAIKPHAKQILAEARKRFKSVAATTKGPRSVEQLLADVDSEAPKLTRELVYNMARAVHMQGYRKEEILDQVTELLQDEFPDVTRAEVAEAFTGYGKIKFPSQEQINKDLRELRNAERITLQIEDVEAGQAPKKTGTQRDKATVWVREKAALLKAAMKKAGMESIPGADRLKGTLDSIKSNYKNRIEELEIAIKNHQKLPPKTRGVTYDEEAAQLKEKAAKLKEEYDAIFGENKDLTEEQRIKRAIDSLSRRIKEEKDLRAANQVRRPAGKPAPDSPAIQILREELAALVKARHEAARALIDSRTPEQRALDRAVASVEKSIAENEQILATGQLPSPRAGAPAYTPSQWLQTQRDRLQALQKRVAKLRRSKLPRLSAEEKERRRAISYYTRAIARLQGVINAGVVVARTAPSASSYDSAVSLLKRENARLKATVKEMQDNAKPKLTDDQKALLRDKAAIRRRITMLENKLAAGDYTRPVKRPAGPGDKELADLRLRKDKLLEQWNEEFVKAEFARKSAFDKSLIYGQEVVNVSRALITSVDLSAIGRQGAFIAFGRPVMAAKAVPSTIHAAFSANRMQRLSEEIQNHPTYALSQQAGLFLADNGPNNLTKQEEAFRSRLSRKAPFKYITVPSERAYNAFLNQIRINSFSAIIGSMGAGVTVEEARAVARFVNIATGRGDLGRFEQAAGGLSAFFFSPKFVVSRFQLLSGLVTTSVDAATGFKAGDWLGSKGTNRARKAVARQYARSLIGIATCYSLIMLAKAGFGDDDDDMKIENDPRSSDFGKVRIGKTRFDFMGGIIQAAVFLSRVSTKVIQKANGEEVSLTEQGWKKDSLWTTITTFIRTKLAPGIGTGINAWGQKDVFDKPTTASSEIIGALIPLTFGDIYSSLQEHGYAKGIPLSVLVLFGIGVQTYDDRLDLEQQISVMMGLSEEGDYRTGSSDPTKPAY